MLVLYYDFYSNSKSNYYIYWLSLSLILATVSFNVLLLLELA